MVLFNSSSCFSSSRTSSSACSSLREEGSSPYSCFKTKTQPIQLRSPYSMVYDDEASSPLSSSADSVRSSCSTRSCAERDAERAEKRRLLDCGMAKLRSSNNVPLRKHLLVFNTVKHLQHDLDLLDDEELYCELMSPAPREKCCHDDKAMEVDVLRSWLAPVVSVPTGSPRVQPAPLKMEERVAPATGAAPLAEDVVQAQNAELSNQSEDHLWSWLSESKTPVKTTSTTTSAFGNGLFTESNQAYSPSSGLDSASSFSVWGGWSTDSSNWTCDSWTPFDLEDSSLSRFELQHLFPSQLLLQA